MFRRRIFPRPVKKMDICAAETPKNEVDCDVSQRAAVPLIERGSRAGRKLLPYSFSQT